MDASHNDPTSNSELILKLTIKTPKEKKDLSIDASSTVKQVIVFIQKKIFFFENCFYFYQLKDLVASEFGTSIDQICLIYSGKILKDDEDLKKHGRRLNKR